MRDQVLARDVGHRDVEDVEILLADQVQQQVERTFERFEKNLEGVRRNIQVRWQLPERLAVQMRKRHAVNSVRRGVGRGRGKRRGAIILARVSWVSWVSRRVSRTVFQALRSLRRLAGGTHVQKFW